MEVSEELKVKNEPICDSQSISSTNRKSIFGMKVKEEPIESVNSQIESMWEEVELKVEEKFSATEFANKISIALFNEETTQETTTNTNQEA